ncbi:MAG: hypothetical protein Q9162_007291 [Coniocarpon cinnabarinum]
MIIALPDDILQLICDALLAQRDLATLYNCAVSCKRLAPCALSDIYRIYNEPTDEDEEAEAQNAAQLELSVQRWAIRWRTIALSALNLTLFPYNRYLRSLDLRDLANLINDERFRGKIDKMFFEGAMKTFRREKEMRVRANRPARKVVDADGVVEMMGDAIVPKTDTLQQLSGPFEATALLKWIPHLPRLQRLELWLGRALLGTDVQMAIYNHCPHFNALSISNWVDPHSPIRATLDPNEADTQLGAFLSGLPEDSLAFFENIWAIGIGEKTCSSLARHARAMRELRLCVEKEAIPHLLLLKDCTSLEKVKFEITGTNVDENAIKQDDLLALEAWLRNCQNLRSIEFFEAMFAPTVLTPVLESKDVHVEELKIQASRSWYAMKENRQFHQSLGRQKSLTSLSLFGDAGEVISDDNSALVEAICQCQNLKHLKLRGVSEYFSEAAVISILISLPLLEELYIQGLNLGDAVLDYVAAHEHLKSICFMDLTSFSFEGLLDFVEKLDESKSNFELSISMASNETLLGEEEVVLIRRALYDKVRGKLEYQAFRDADASDFSVTSD